MTRILLLLYFSAGFALATFGQNSIQSVQDLESYLVSSGEMIQKRNQTEQVEGTPYLDETFNPGSLRYDGKWITDVSLRYNIYSDKFEIQFPTGIIEIDPVMNPIDSIRLNDHTFLFNPNRSGIDASFFYFEAMYHTHGISLLKKYNAVIQPYQPPSAYGKEVPASFELVSPEYFLYDGTISLKISGLNTLSEFFNIAKKEIRSYSRENGLSSRKEEDLVKLVSYFSKK